MVRIIILQLFYLKAPLKKKTKHLNVFVPQKGHPPPQRLHYILLPKKIRWKPSVLAHDKFIKYGMSWTASICWQCWKATLLLWLNVSLFLLNNLYFKIHLGCWVWTKRSWWWTIIGEAPCGAKHCVCVPVPVSVCVDSTHSKYKPLTSKRSMRCFL